MYFVCVEYKGIAFIGTAVTCSLSLDACKTERSHINNNFTKCKKKKSITVKCQPIYPCFLFTPNPSLIDVGRPVGTRTNMISFFKMTISAVVKSFRSTINRDIIVLRKSMLFCCVLTFFFLVISASANFFGRLSQEKILVYFKCGTHTRMQWFALSAESGVLVFMYCTLNYMREFAIISTTTVRHYCIPASSYDRFQANRTKQNSKK